MLPNWIGADGAYRNAYKNLSRMCAAEARGVKGRYSPSDDVREYIKALDIGDEETIKYLNLRHIG